MYYLRVNGRGNAWPLQIAKQHPMYQEDGNMDYANASYSICKSNTENYQANNLDWEVVVDAGHGIVPFILNHHNRIPEAIVLTHAHFDHILGVDWIVQSYYRQNKKKYPIYASEPCIEAFNTVLHHLSEQIEWNILKVGENTSIKEAPGLNVTNFPVYHGYSAKGASLLLFNLNNTTNKVIITGDILCPLIKNEDQKKLANAELLLVDSNNRFPYPKTNHWSFSNHHNINTSFNEFIDGFELTSLLKPHYMSESEKNYILEVMSEKDKAEDLCWNIVEFVKKITPSKIGLVHYSGIEDEKYYNEKVLNSTELETWANKKAEENNVSSAITVPKTGELIRIFS